MRTISMIFVVLMIAFAIVDFINHNYGWGFFCLFAAYLNYRNLKN